MSVISLNGSFITISGKIMDSLGNPLPGAHIYDPSNTIVGTTTDLNGNFSLKIGYMETVKISYMGFNSKIYRAGSTPKTIQLSASDNKLNEIVLTAPKKASITKTIFKTTGFKLGLAALFLGGLLMGNPKKSTKGLNGFAKVEL